MAGDEGSPNDDTSSTSKRRRIVFSCLSCRRRKLKCDRIFPSCGRCQKGGHPDSCAYDSEAVEFGLPKSSADRTSSGGNTGLIRAIPRLPSVARSFAADEGDDDSPKEQPPEDAPSSLSAPDEHIRQLEARIIGLEKAIHGSRSQWLGLARSPELARTERMQASEQRETAMNETMIFRGKNFKTQYFGASHHTSQLSHIGSLRIFMKDMIVQHPQLAQVQREVHGNKIKEHGQNDGIPANDSTLVELLPQRNVADELVRIYISNFETTHRILHLPTFWAEYHPLWNAPHQSRPAFVALVLLILATTHCIRGNEPAMFRGDSSVKRETAITWVRQCDSWLDSQSHKHVTITVFQLHCLSFIAKQMNAIKRKRTWISAGNLLRLAMSAGLHRDAQIINLRHATPSRQKVSVFDQEMRRRIWATVLELELQAATERGMPAMTRDLLEDCGAPSNLEDEEFDQSTERLPNPRPITQYTRSSYQHLSRSSWSLRSELLSLINGLNPQLPYEEVLRYDKKIMQVLDDIPQWNVEEGLVAQTLLQLQAQQLLLFLYRPYARDGTWGSRYDYSAIVHLRSAMKILDLHYRLASNGNSFLHLYRNDVLGAALSICYNVSLSDPEPGTSTQSV